ncbi:GNAT family N-acetyltransferase [Streptomyces sp. NBC_00091]|uniref:GNAT family N-acetyltransferase n=1 Tax=Streptomyces sp. NBC_00091 TaxID=2975648 RepID=UPI002259FA62|nr:GNAT family N-acetyltransferase [Streptomyces sp. NBC_00091]MCX5377890.1 GNAT family N-acetyltransferase [Streptomyces sp. NBC_00091]
MSHGINLRAVPYDHPDALRLDAQVQVEYQQRYDGEGDATFLDPAMFVPPSGLYLVAYDASGTPVASGGWRGQEKNEEGYSDGDAEIKRMYVVPQARGLGLARRILAELEADAHAAGRRRMVLETGDQQPEAIALYLSSGYALSEKFGYYRFYESSRCMTKPLPAPSS